MTFAISKSIQIYEKYLEIFFSRYLRGLMGNFNERAENLMDELTKLADSKKEAKMLQLFNHVTLDVITKVLHPNICPSWSLMESLQVIYCPCFLPGRLTCSTETENSFPSKTLKISKRFTDVSLLIFRWPLE